MNKVFAGGYFALCGTMGSSVLLAVAAINPVSGWSTPPGRFLTTVLSNGTFVPLCLFAAMMVIGAGLLSASILEKNK